MDLRAKVEKCGNITLTFSTDIHSSERSTLFNLSRAFNSERGNATGVLTKEALREADLVSQWTVGKHVSAIDPDSKRLKWGRIVRVNSETRKVTIRFDGNFYTTDVIFGNIEPDDAPPPAPPMFRDNVSHSSHPSHLPAAPPQFTNNVSRTPFDNPFDSIHTPPPTRNPPQVPQLQRSMSLPQATPPPAPAPFTRQVSHTDMRPFVPPVDREETTDPPLPPRPPESSLNMTGDESDLREDDYITFYESCCNCGIVKKCDKIRCTIRDQIYRFFTNIQEFINSCLVTLPKELRWVFIMVIAYQAWLVWLPGLKKARRERAERIKLCHKHFRINESDCVCPDKSSVFTDALSYSPCTVMASTLCSNYKKCIKNGLPKRPKSKTKRKRKSKRRRGRKRKPSYERSTEPSNPETSVSKTPGETTTDGEPEMKYTPESEEFKTLQKDLKITDCKLEKYKQRGSRSSINVIRCTPTEESKKKESSPYILWGFLFGFVYLAIYNTGDEDIRPRERAEGEMETTVDDVGDANDSDGEESEF